LVRSGFVLAGEHWSRPLSFEIGICALATLELSGPTDRDHVGLADDLGHVVRAVCGSCAPFSASS
jgi:hypothetical protein